jgi:hypothetical protein
MSRPNRSFPAFNYNIQEAPDQYQYDLGNQASRQSNQSSQQWLSSAPRSVQLNLPSPSTSVRSTATAAAQIPFDRSSFHQANVAPVQDPIDPRLHGMSNLLTPDTYGSRANYNPIARSFQDESWNTYHLRNGDVSDIRNPLSQSNVGYKTYPSGPGSAGSAVPRSDSGYHTQSGMSNDPSRVDVSSLPSSLTLQVGNIDIQSTSGEAPGMLRAHSDQRSQISSRSGRSGNQNNTLTCLQCSEVSKCMSDFKCVLRSTLWPSLTDRHVQKAQAQTR